jgi:MFS family permease
MAAATYGNENLAVVHRGIYWSAVWGGFFTFMAIWSVFGALGVAIFASMANPNVPRPVTGMSVGESIWVIVLTAIAMYIGGLVTGRLAAVATRNEGAVHGQAMFGLSVVGALLLVILATAGLTVTGPTEVSAHSPYILGAIAQVGWAGFLALLLGWICAMIGGSLGLEQRTITVGSEKPAGSEKPVQPFRKVA